MNRAKQSGLINTPPQRGARRLRNAANRFNGFSDIVKTVETVSRSSTPLATPLKRGVNEKHPLLQRSLPQTNTDEPGAACTAITGFWSAVAERNGDTAFRAQPCQPKRR